MPRSKTTRRNGKRRMHTKRVLKGGNPRIETNLKSIVELATQALEQFKVDNKFVPEFKPRILSASDYASKSETDAMRLAQHNERRREQHKN